MHPTPIKTSAGWHVIELVDSRAINIPTPEQTRNIVEQVLARQALAEKLESLQSKSSKP